MIDFDDIVTEKDSKFCRLCGCFFKKFNHSCYVYHKKYLVYKISDEEMAKRSDRIIFERAINYGGLNEYRRKKTSEWTKHLM